MNELKNCKLCPRECGTDRFESKGFCGASDKIAAAKAFLHKWEEPCISGEYGSGTIFFSNCNLNCVFCQNYKISQEGFGKEISIDRLAEIMLELQTQKAANINLVSPAPYTLHIKMAVEKARSMGLILPIVYNTNGYDSINTLRMLEGIIDIYLPDFKYYSDGIDKKYSNVKDYRSRAEEAVLEMYRQTGLPRFNNKGIMTGGLLIRHLILPDMLGDTKKILQWIRDRIGQDAYVSLMCQYIPQYKAYKYEELNRKLEEWEYEYIIDYFFRIGLKNGFVQEHSSATEDYIPDFDLTGI